MFFSSSMAQYEKFDDDTPSPKFTVVTSSNPENTKLFTSSEPSLSPEEQTTAHDAIITLNIISVFVSTVCGVITFFLAIEDQSASALGFATGYHSRCFSISSCDLAFYESQRTRKTRDVCLKNFSHTFLRFGFCGIH